MTKNEAIQKVISIALGEVGYLEKQNNSNLYSKTANAGYNNYTKYWAEVLPEWQGQAWCACFVTWVFQKAFGKDNTKKLLKHYPYVYCPTMKNLFTLNANPKVGDIVIFYYNNQFAHTGIVTKVNGDYFKTVEGNTNNGTTIIPNGGGVCEKSYYNSKLPGTKFITVNWDLVANTSNGTSNNTTTNTSSLSAFRVWVGELQKECNLRGYSKLALGKNQAVDCYPGPNTLNSCPTLCKGSKGNIVKLLQQRLIALGYSCGSYGADGDFGTGTYNAVVKFQKDHYLSADGIVGKNTWRKLLCL